MKTLILICLLFIVGCQSKTYTASDFNIETVVSAVDYNANGQNDYLDILAGAKLDAQNKPTYDSTYVAGGYPQEDKGVCTDLIWRAFREAGYSLKDMIDYDIVNNPDDYRFIESPDPNIDFRRVPNLVDFFDQYAESLTLDIHDIEQWQPGDIVVFSNEKHIGILSDLRNEKGIPYVLHNSGQSNREEDYLQRNPVIRHYRFNSQKIDEKVLFPFNP